MELLFNRLKNLIDKVNERDQIATKSEWIELVNIIIAMDELASYEGFSS